MIEVDVGAILYNIQTLRQMLGGVKLCCVVKGDGYGCGDVRMSRVLEEYACVDMLAVAMLDEALHLRSSGIHLPILVLGDIADEDAEQVINHNLVPSIYRVEFARKLNQLAEGRQVPVHVRLDVCSGSPGMLAEEFARVLPELLALPNLRLAGVYTQLYGAYVEDKRGMIRQLEEFKSAIALLPKGLREKICVHAASTAAACRFPEARMDMVRVGAAVYGLPFDEQPSPFKPVMSIRSRIISLKTVDGQAFTGYHETQPHAGRRRLATVLGGYEDALFLMFMHGGHMLVHGRRAPIVGEACMDTATIDVTDIPDVQLSDEAVLLGRQGGAEITLYEVMRQSGFTLANSQLAFKTGRRTPKRYVNYPENLAWRPLLNQVLQHSPTLREAMDRAAGQTLEQYVERLAGFTPGTALSDPGDLTRAAQNALAPLLGPEEASNAAACLASGCALTANHHGVDCFAQSVQGNLLFRHLLEKRGMSARNTPVLACGSVPLDNSSYGKGLLLFETLDGRYPLRVPVIPNRYNDSIVGLFPAITREMVDKALAALEGDRYRQRLSETMLRTTRHVLEDFYGKPSVLAMASYVQQACAINLEMTREALGCGFAYLDLEKIAASLLLLDLRRPDSLASLVVKDRRLRNEVYAALDGAVGCWNREALRAGQWSSAGTTLFWAVGERWTRIPLLDDGDALVNGRSGESIAYDAVPQALEEGRIYPALLMCFLPLLFARGVRCFGGCFQPEYLRAMRDGLALALGRAGRASLAGVVASQDPSGYLSGPMFLEGASGTPRGIVELLAQKPSISERKNWMNVTFEQAHRIALANLYPDVVPANERVADFTALLAR